MKKILLIATQLCWSLAAVAQTAYNTAEYVDINSIKAASLVHGDMWYRPDSNTGGVEYPKGSGKKVIYSGSLWMAAYDQQAALHVSAQTYRQNGNDFWPGPLDSATGAASATVSQNWAKIWKVNRATIDSFIAITSHTIANTPAVILQWPAKGNVNARGNNNAVLQITEDMAPFADVNNDGIYDALSGDYPKIKGDQMLWSVFNDNGVTHASTGGLPLKIQVQTSAYAYKQTGDLSRVIYYEYLIKNKSGIAYNDATIGVMADPDLGYGFNDYIGFDSVHRMGISYNGASTDAVYGNLLPMSGVSLLQLPGDAGSIHQPAGSFMYFNNDFTGKGNPSSPMQFGYYMHSIFRDSTHLKDNLGNDVAYAFPGDPANSQSWSECNMANVAGDRRFVIASNSFNLAANGSVKMAMALMVTIPDTNSGCPNGGFAKIKDLADSAWVYYSNPPTATTGIGQLAGISKLSLYPNPAETVLYIEKPLTTGTETVLVYDALGRYIPVEISAKNNLLSLDIKNLPNGVYTVQYRNGTVTAAGVFVKK